MNIKRRRLVGILSRILITLIAVFVLAIGTLFLMQSGRDFDGVTIEAPGYTLNGSVSYGNNANGPWVIFVHGNRKSGMAHPLYQMILHNLDESVSVLAIDMRGFGASSVEGMAAADRILDREQDIVAAAGWIKAEFGIDEEQIILIGHSLGALQVLRAASNSPFGGVISIGPGAFEMFVRDSQARVEYRNKFERNTGIRLPTQTLIHDAQFLMLPRLLSPCPPGKMFVLHGSRETDMLNARRRDIAADCDARIEWHSIALSDHVYGTESRLPMPIAKIYSAFLGSMLMRRVNRSVSAVLESSDRGRR